MQAELEAVWQKVVDAWDDPARHDGLMGLVAQESAFAWAAAKYKERAGDPVADRQLERIRKAALATMFASGSKKRETHSPYRSTIVIFVVLIVVLLVGLVGMKMISATHVEDPTPRAPTTTPAPH